MEIPPKNNFGWVEQRSKIPASEKERERLPSADCSCKFDGAFKVLAIQLIPWQYFMLKFIGRLKSRQNREGTGEPEHVEEQDPKKKTEDQIEDKTED